MRALRRLRDVCLGFTLLLAAVLFLSSEAHAQAPAASAPPTATRFARAKKLFQDGTALMKEGLYQQAIAAFVEAEALAPRESIQNNIALAYREMKDMASAYREYSILVERYGETMASAKKAAAMRAIDDLAVLTGVAVIGVTEPDATVTADGKIVGKTPLTNSVRLNIGTHSIVVEKPGFEPLQQVVEIHGHDSVSVPGPLEKEVLTGHAVVTAQPSDASTEIFVDGVRMGVAPWGGDLSPGTHTFVARSTAMASEPSTVNVVKKGTYEINLVQTAQTSTLAIRAEGRNTAAAIGPPGAALAVGLPAAAIAIDGKVVGQGTFEAKLPSGVHDVDVSAIGYVPFHMSVTLTAGQRTEQVVTLVAATPVAPPHDWKGIYAQLTFLALLEAGKPTNDIAEGNGYTSGTQISGTSAAGGGIDVRVGYSWGILGVEGSVLTSFDYSSATANVTQRQNSVEHPAGTAMDAYNEGYDFYRVGADITVGARLMPKFQVVRPTVGAGFGVAVKATKYSRGIAGSSVDGADSYSSGFTPYVAPVLVLDGGIEIGHTPGTRFYVGALMTAEFAGVVEASGVNAQSGTAAFPVANIAVVRSTEVFIGPFLGMQFGE